MNWFMRFFAGLFIALGLGLVGYAVWCTMQAPSKPHVCCGCGCGKCDCTCNGCCKR